MDWQSLIKRHEGFRARLYCDRCGEALIRETTGWFCGCAALGNVPGNITIGYGTNLSSAGVNALEGGELLYARASAVADELAVFPWLDQLDPVRYTAILDMAYTMGVPRFTGFHDAIAAMAARLYNDAADAILDSAWHGEAKTRCEEIAMMVRTGKWPK